MESAADVMQGQNSPLTSLGKMIHSLAGQKEAEFTSWFTKQTKREWLICLAQEWSVPERMTANYCKNI